MAQTIMIYDFGTNEEAAQQARHKVEGWTQGFRLGKKILFKFDREEVDGENQETASAAQAPQEGKESGKAGKKSEKKSGEEQSDGSRTRVRVLLKLDFSDHEKLTSQRWLDRIPSEEPFKYAKREAIRQGNTGFPAASKRFDLLD